MIHVTPWLVALSLKLNAHVHLAPVVLCWCAHAFAVTHCLHVCICLVCVITNGLLCFIVRVMLVLRVSVFVFWLLRLASHLDQFSWQLDNITPTECLQSDSPSPSSLSLSFAPFPVSLFHLHSLQSHSLERITRFCSSFLSFFSVLQWLMMSR